MTAVTVAPIANPPNNAQLGGTPTIPPTYIRVYVVMWECSDRQTNMCDQYTFRIVYNSREM